MNQREYDNLKEEVEEAKRAADKAEGALEQLMKDLRKECGCKTMEQAEAKLETLEKETKKAKKAYEKAFNEFNEKWEDEDDN